MGQPGVRRSFQPRGHRRAPPQTSRRVRRAGGVMSRKKISFREKDAAGPPDNDFWVWHTSEFLRSSALRGASVWLRRLLDMLEVQHLKSERRHNGRLMLAYDDMVKAGFTMSS